MEIDTTNEISQVLDGWTMGNTKLDQASLDELHSLTRETLSEVSSLSNYLDETAGRVLAAIAFLSALAGTIYSGLYGKIPTPCMLGYAFHGLFFVAMLLVAIGAFLVVKGIRISFFIPKSWQQPSTKPVSMLFAPQIAKATAKDWANAFKHDNIDQVKALKLQYIKDRIHESYLVAKGVEGRRNTLTRGLSFLIAAIVVFGAWLLVTASTVLMNTAPSPTVLLHPSALVFTDADNTLWDTNAVYAKAQLDLLSRVESIVGRKADGDRLAFVRRIDQDIAKVNPDGLRYPPRLLAEGLADALKPSVASTHSSTTPATQAVVATAKLDPVAEEHKFLDDLTAVPELRPGVREGLERLHRLGVPVIIVTEGSEASALKRANHHNLLPLITAVVEVRKSADSFKELTGKYRGDAKRIFSVGDQLDRDIQFAAAAGCTTVYFPGGFAPAWLPDVGTIKPDHQIASFDKVADLVEQKSN